MKSAVKAARSVHLNGTVHNAGRAIGLNLGLIRAGGLSGTITDNGVPLSLTETASKVYIKATQPVLRQFGASPSLCSVLCGKYIQMTPVQSGALAGNLSMDRLLASLTGQLPKFSNGGTTTVHGQQAQVLRAKDGSKLDVAASGTAYPLRATGKGSTGQLNFTQWNNVKQPPPPPSNQVINLSRLGR